MRCDGRPRRILFVQRTRGGGSLIHVLMLVKNLDREFFSPIVLLYGDNPYEAEFRETGAEVRILDDAVTFRPVSRLVTRGMVPKDRARRSFRTARRLNGFIQRDVKLARRTACVIESAQADLVQSNISPSFDRATILAAGLVRVPQISYSQFWTAEEPWLDRPLSAFVDRYLCNSEAVRSHLRSATGIPEGKTDVVYGPFEFPGYPIPPAPASVREDLGVTDRHSLIANVGRVVPWKGQDVFLRAFATITRHHPEARALVVGSAGDSIDGRRYEADLRRLTSDLNLVGRVIFTGHRRDVENLMTASDVIVHSSSKAEPLGRVVMEAIALGRPVIATGAGGVPEMVEDGVTGSLVPPGDVEAMARAIDSVLTDPARAAAMSTRARTAAQTRFSTKAFVRRMECEFRRVLGD